jgi:hypothetical protein
LLPIEVTACPGLRLHILAIRFTKSGVEEHIRLDTIAVKLETLPETAMVRFFYTFGFLIKKYSFSSKTIALFQFRAFCSMNKGQIKITQTRLLIPVSSRF